MARSAWQDPVAVFRLRLQRKRKEMERRFNRFNIACNVFDRKPGCQKTDEISESYGTVIIWCNTESIC